MENYEIKNKSKEELLEIIEKQENEIKNLKHSTLKILWMVTLKSIIVVSIFFLGLMSFLKIMNSIDM